MHSAASTPSDSSFSLQACTLNSLEKPISKISQSYSKNESKMIGQK